MAILSANGVAAATTPVAAGNAAAAEIFALKAHAGQASRTYIVKAGQNLSLISKAVYGHARWWPELYWRNLSHIHDPSTMTIYPGEHLRVPEAWRRRPAVPRAYRPAPPPAPVPASVSAGVTQDSSSGAGSNAASFTPAASYGGSGVGGAFGDCVRARESGGDYQVTNASGHYGAYQFSESTWEAYGGSAASFGHASPAQQDQVFANALARGGQSNWSPYDGCSSGLATSAARTGPPSHFFGAGVAVGAAVAHRARFVPLRALAFGQALRYRWHWYGWGGTGPSVFDCSGLVYRSYLNLGHALPRTTYDMLAGGGHLHYTAHPRKGMLAFYGSGHVELYVRPGVTYGAEKSGTQINYHHWSGFWHPTMFMWVSRR